jgi:hypothetical protein
LPLRFRVFDLRLPSGDRIEIRPVTHRDPDLGASVVDAEVSRLRRRELEHAVGSLVIAVAGLRITPRREDDGVVRRLRGLREIHSGILSPRLDRRISDI